ncbi:hypothetical protein [Hydrogenimonas cancrithermarum]|uniref:Uncharacterized protein n=1 Tax=Hydrogenimonas cancrithermarum TaxID=2993563 RepID=A0ABN6WXT0_9BACT|nr:hypothetical protein [Hydrogenimonas cancrithermarum]BDY13983.1 hypothetical protein HCR_22960 [Hydrogenimonas cancrithermarum]
MSWGSFVAGLIGGAFLAGDGPEEDAKVKWSGPEGTFLGPNDRRVQSEINYKTREYAKLAVEKLPYYASLYSAPNLDQLGYILKPFEAAATMELKGGFPMVKMGATFDEVTSEAEAEWNDLLEYFAIGLSEVAILLEGRVYAALTQHFSDYFLVRVRKFVSQHPLIVKGVLQDRYQLFEMQRKRFGTRYLDAGDEETAKRFVPVKTSYENYRLNAELAIRDWERELPKRDVPEEEWRPLLEEYKALRLKERMPSLREIKRAYDISNKLQKMREAVPT